jgi:Dos2-interacting transcription regulator of RNA-Pol-II
MEGWDEPLIQPGPQQLPMVASPGNQTSISAATEELFHIWQTNCLSIHDPPQSPHNVGSADEISSKLEACQVEARNFFASLVAGTSVQIADGVVLQTRASHTDSLALLIRSLEPCFADTASLVARWAALSCLVGSIQGCRHSAATMSLALVQLMGNFLLVHVGPCLIDNDNDDGVDEKIRDVALTGLVALLQCCRDDSKQPTKGIHDGGPSDSASQWLKIRVTLAQSAVEQRCVSPSGQNYTHRTGYHSNNGDGYSKSITTASGLSLLPRARRSQCFSVMQAAVDAVASDTHGGFVKQEGPYKEAIDFCKFAATLLHGESDPRCLLQLLMLFDSIQETFKFLGASFPRSEIFDAVAPYYPIQFNPPPNDSHGITRKSLRQAVVRVLSCSYYDEGRHYDDNMASLACGLMLEAMVPLPEDGPLTYQEQFETLEDLQTFLLSTRGADHETNCDQLDQTEIKRVAEALLSVHETSSLAVSRGEENPLVKAIAELCRTVVAQVAVSLERNTKCTAQWEAFAQEPILVLSMKQDSTASGRIATAYLAALAASGGTKTIRLSLQAGLRQLFYTLQESSDQSNISSSLYGIGAFFSSCRVAIERASKDGIVVHPHPLEPYGNEALDRILEILSPDGSARNPNLLSVEVGAIRALESVLLASPPCLFSGDRTDRIIALVQRLSSRLLVSSIKDSDESMDNEPMEAIAVTIGTLLGKALDASNRNNDGVGSTVNLPSSGTQESDGLSGFLMQNFVPALLASVKIPHAPRSRFDRDTLAIAASFSLPAASRIVESLASTLHNALLGEQDATAIYIAETLSFLFALEAKYAVRAYQNMANTSTSAFELVKAFAPNVPAQGDGVEDDFGMSNLQLPKSKDDRDKAMHRVEKAYEIIPHLRNGYKLGLSPEHFSALVEYVDHLLPPLNDDDVVGLSTALPFLSAALEAMDTTACAVDSSTMSAGDMLRRMQRDLAEFAITPEYFASARSHAGRCLHEIVCRLSIVKTSQCEAQELVRYVMSTMNAAVVTIRRPGNKAEDRESAADLLADCLSLLAILGSATARCGGPSSKTSDQIVSCLIDVASEESATFLFSDGGIEQIQLEPFAAKDAETSARLAVRAASACGSILSTDCRNSLWQQRLTHLAFNRIAQRIRSSGFLDERNTPAQGLLSALCQVVCSTNLRTVSCTTLQTAAEALMCSLSSARLRAASQVDEALPEIVLASIVKLMSASPTAFPYIYPLVTGSLLAFASAADLEQRSEVACKILALQVLAAVTTMHNSTETLKTIKPGVVSLLLTATNHPSGLVRAAVGEVRNAWYFID